MQSSKEKLKKLPTTPGCYLFKNKDQEILYVGKAKNLRNRVRSYFATNADLAPAKQIMIGLIEDLDYITVRTEQEALLLEANLIKEHKPPYNVILKDDKFFKYIKIVNEPFPRIIATRKIEPDGSEYFGPYSSAGSVKQTLKLLRNIFHFRTAKKHDFIFDVLKAGEHISEQEYAGIIAQVRNILRGNIKPVIKKLNLQMKAASKSEQFEQAARLRDHIEHLKRLNAYQQAVVSPSISADVLNATTFNNKTYIALLKIRKGKLLDKLNAELNNPLDDIRQVLTAFVKQLYPDLIDQPKQLITSVSLDLTEQDVQAIFSRPVKLHTPQRGKFKKFLELALLNAEEYASRSQTSFIAARDIDGALKQLQKKLKLRKKLTRIECFDISNVQGKHAVGSMVVFTNGQPDKSQYRKFSIRYTSTEQPNDFAMMAEVLARRFKHPDWPNPDLVILDGGKGQLSVVLKTLAHMNVAVPIVALAKKHEEIHIPLTKAPVTLQAKSPAFFLVQRIRDEAHRFAITYYRLKHKKSYTKKDGRQ